VRAVQADREQNHGRKVARSYIQHVAEWIGNIATPGVCCSSHPIYRVCALGPLAETLTKGHERAATNCGLGILLDEMTRHRTWIIGVGTTIEILNQLNHPEDVLADAFLVSRATGGNALEIRIKDGKPVASVPSHPPRTRTRQAASAA